MDYNFREIEQKWRTFWGENKTFKTVEDLEKPKFYVLDMFPYPSGAGLHVGHPLGYIASDIYARYKRLQGYNVLHPMGYDSFGLPAEQYAIETGQHPAVTTEQNIKRYRQQLDKIGFSFDWDREIRTSNPDYYKWTQWIFKQFFNSYYDNKADKAKPIGELIKIFNEKGNKDVDTSNSCSIVFTAEEWRDFSEERQQEILQDYRLTYLAETWVNWCPKLGTVLANDEVVNGRSVRGNHPVVQKKMLQWSMRITAYAERLLQGLEQLDWSDAIKEQQRNWIGKSVGASVFFMIDGHNEKIEVFTTRPDTIFGVSFMVLAPEHLLVEKITTSEYKEKVTEYQKEASLKTERDRQANVKDISGEFTGAYAIHPFTGEKIPIWIGDYVLASYGTGAVMSVPCGDQRDWDFAKYFNLPIKNIFKDIDVSEGAYTEKDSVIDNSDFLNGLPYKEAFEKAIEEIEKRGFGQKKINYRLRDAVFSRQRFWGEPFPIYYKGNTPYVIEDEYLPITLPKVDKYLPTEDGDPPLARAKREDWNYFNGDRMEYNTMPGWAGSSWYFVRYLDPKNDDEFVAKDKVEYWKNVDLYIGGSEHATGHLLYARFWTKFLYDLGYLPFDEPFQKMINQGMILGRSSLAYRIKDSNTFVTLSKKDDFEASAIHVDISLVDNDKLNVERFREWREEYKNAEFITEEDGSFICGSEVEKMSKSKYNVENPDDLVERFGADTLRMYEMFLGPLEQSKPWDTKGINGVHNFLRKFWRLFHDKEGNFAVSEEKPSKESLKTLHKTIKKVTEDLNRYSFNTVVSTLMICVNELNDQKCHHREVLEPLTVLISPYAPFIAEELWTKLGHEEGTVSQASFPVFEEQYLVESSHEYPVSFNGKMRFKLELPLDLAPKDIEKVILEHEKSQKWLDGKIPKKVIVVPGKIVNVVV